MEKPAIVVVGYNRANSMKRLLESIESAIYPEEDVTLIISIDYHPNNQDVIEVAENFVWKYGTKKIKVHSENLGLRAHVLECGDYSYEYGSVIILEDDLMVSKDFYNYGKSALDYYKDDERIAGISLYSGQWNEFARCIFSPIKTQYDVYFRQTCESWGECWTMHQWDRFRKWYSEHLELPAGIRMPKEIYSWPETSWAKFFLFLRNL